MFSFKSYKDRLDYLKSISKFHFDPFKKDEEPFFVLGRFVGQEWWPEVEAMEREAKGGSGFDFNKALDYGGKKRLNLQFDLKLTGEKYYSPEHTFLNRIEEPVLCREKAPTIYKMVDWFAMAPDTLDARIHIQHPGQVFPVHVDGLMRQKTTDRVADKMQDQPEDWARFQVALQDWVWGHHWEMGNSHWSQWHAGEIMYFRWWETPHSTANSGFSPRYTLQITGKLTDKTRERLKCRNDTVDLTKL